MGLFLFTFNQRRVKVVKSSVWYEPRDSSWFNGPGSEVESSYHQRTAPCIVKLIKVQKTPQGRRPLLRQQSLDIKSTVV